MREILFRAKLSENPITGKRIKNGEFVEGFYVSSQHDPYDARTFTIETDTDVYHIIPETVGQYTGLTDKNGQKIFEGDKVNIYLNASADDEPEDTGVIIFQDGAFGVKFNRRFSMVRNQFLPCYSIMEYYKGFFEVIK